MKKDLELYIHIPFCARKCNYCDFLSAPASQDEMLKYTDFLCKEIKSQGSLPLKYRVVSIFFGGGTPSLLPLEQMGQIVNTIKESFEVVSTCEITLECNPGTVTKEKLEGYIGLGINRLSFGLQSANNEELRLLGRIHTFEEFVVNYEHAREVGFQNINIDLMSALPYQTLESYETTLKKVLELKPEHISAYSLILEEGTSFYDRYSEHGEEKDAIPDVILDRTMYEHTKTILLSHGYNRYEISNYAKPGKECLHNIGYWKRVEYLGLGLGASSLLYHVRYRNLDTIISYEKALESSMKVRQVEEKLSKKAEMEEFMFLGLRLCEGVSKKDFKRQFSLTMEEVYGNKLVQLQKAGLLMNVEDNVFLTDRGIDLSNQVFTEFLLDETYLT
ncbi:radical SAM family heme chaperone HemW [Lachnoclostridium phytofermentans]|uniref:radical SAM family heme chaperone HemW n=1 Tax=Lachnoclostridium phytofermentans TaxID=66219 RepID=UPI000497D894|nr:radical SAM family heme chaperone HemW [Lachnoclostridium phytofermentans]